MRLLLSKCIARRPTYALWTEPTSSALEGFRDGLYLWLRPGSKLEHLQPDEARRASGAEWGRAVVTLVTGMISRATALYVLKRVGLLDPKFKLTESPLFT